MRVITNYGFGEAPELLGFSEDDSIEVTMENPADPLGAKQVLPKNEVYEFGDYAVIRVVVVEGVGPCSNILPFENQAEAWEFYEAPSPGGETRFLLDLADGTFQVSRRLGLAAGRYLRINPWLDRWARERQGNPEDDEGQDTPESSVAAFDGEVEKSGGTSGGICTNVLVDIIEGKILRFAIFAMACRGTVFDKRFGC